MGVVSATLRAAAQVRSWLRAVGQRHRLEAEMDTELTDHLERLTADLVRSGLTAREATRSARITMGSAMNHKEAMRASLGLRLVDEMRDDLRYATRVLVKNPAFTAVAAISLALGIGANTAVFTAAKRVLLDPLPVKRPSQLRMLTWVSGHQQLVPPVWGDVVSTESGLMSSAFSYPVFAELRKRTDVFQDIVAFKDIGEITITVDGHSETAPAELLSGNAFEALGVKAVIGRSFTLADDQRTSNPVALISERFWTERFGRSTSVLGQWIELNGVHVTVIGVCPRAFSGLTMGETAQIFVPVTLQPLIVPRAQKTETGNPSLLDNSQSWWLSVLLRLRPDVPEERTQAVLDVALRQAAMATIAEPKGIESFHLRLQPGNRGADLLREFAVPSYVLLGLAGLVLLLACVNIATLLLARGIARLPEITTRLALGAGKNRIIRQLLTESLLLSALGGVLGLGVGYLARNVIPRMVENPWKSETLQMDFDWSVLAFTCAVAFITGVFFGAIPALRAAHMDAALAMKNGRRMEGPSGMLFGKGLVAGQVALSTILLIGALLFVRTVINLSSRPLGFQADHLLLFRLNPPRTRYTDQQVVRLYQQLEEKFVAIPGVKSASLSNIAIIGDGHSGSTFHILGRPREDEAPRVQTNSVGADFFQTMGIPTLRGRSFNVRDTATSPRVAVINRTLAQQYFRKQDPIGKLFEADAEDTGEPTQIVGVVADTQYADLRSQTPPTFYLPYRQRSFLGRIVVELRTAGDPGAVLPEARSAVESLDRDLPLIDVHTMTQQVQATIATERMFAQLTCGFGILALVLSSVGIYGLVAYSVSQRTREIGIRMALGAQRSQVRGWVIRNSVWLALAGTLIGAGSGILLSRLVAAMLYGVRADDLTTLVAAVLMLLLAACAAAWVPARRAASVQPMDALRHE